MKNVLLASSAIVGAAALVASPAAAQEISLSAFQDFLVSGGDADVETSDRGFGFGTNTEIHFNASMMADNGITFGFRVELEGDFGSTAHVDENSIFASGSFGKLEFGNNDGAEDTFMVNGTNVGINYGGIANPTTNFLDNALPGEARTSVDFGNGADTSDATKITYTTPNFNGFSAGVSYTPDSAHDGVGNSFLDANSSGTHDHIGLGLGYDGEFNGVGVDLGVVAAWGKNDGEPEDDIYGIGGGLVVSFGGFSIGGSAIYDDGDGNGGENTAFDVGVGYSAGPWTFAIAGLYSEADESGDELLAGSASITYNLAPGVNVFLTGFVGEEDYGSASEADLGTDSNDVVAVTSGLRVSFLGC